MGAATPGRGRKIDETDRVSCGRDRGGRGALLGIGQKEIAHCQESRYHLSGSYYSAPFLTPPHFTTRVPHPSYSPLTASAKDPQPCRIFCTPNNSRTIVLGGEQIQSAPSAFC